MHNYAAYTFMVRPWDWTALVFLRVCHEVHYFGQVTTDTKTQRSLMETFIDEVRELIDRFHLITRPVSRCSPTTASA